MRSSARGWCGVRWPSRTWYHAQAVAWCRSLLIPLPCCCFLLQAEGPPQLAVGSNPAGSQPQVPGPLSLSLLIDLQKDPHFSKIKTHTQKGCKCGEVIFTAAIQVFLLRFQFLFYPMSQLKFFWTPTRINCSNSKVSQNHVKIKDKCSPFCSKTSKTLRFLRLQDEVLPNGFLKGGIL